LTFYKKRTIQNETEQVKKQQQNALKLL